MGRYVAGRLLDFLENIYRYNYFVKIFSIILLAIQVVLLYGDFKWQENPKNPMSDQLNVTNLTLPNGIKKPSDFDSYFRVKLSITILQFLYFITMFVIIVIILIKKSRTKKKHF